jgi:hypothetical protein
MGIGFASIAEVLIEVGHRTCMIARFHRTHWHTSMVKAPAFDSILLVRCLHWKRSVKARSAIGDLKSGFSFGVGFRGSKFELP